MARVRMLFGDKSKDSSYASPLPDFYTLPHCSDDNEDLLSSGVPVVNDKDMMRLSRDTESSANVLIATDDELPDRLSGVKRKSSSCIEAPCKLPKVNINADSDASVTSYQGMIRGTNIYTNTELFTIDDFNEVMKI